MSLTEVFQAQLPVLPVLLPAATAMILLLLGDGGSDMDGGHGRRKLKWARRIAMVSVGIGLVLAFLSRLSSYRDQAGQD
mgnify:CR=1 FL=1